jgi:peptidylprolyl isomerase
LKTRPSTAFRTATGVAIEILKQGIGDEHPTLTSLVKLNYFLWTPDGALFESTIISANPASVLLALAVPGWREASG